MASAVLNAIGGPANRVRIASDRFWLSPDSLIYAEHGHQLGKEVNKFDGWPRPFVTYQGSQYLQRPWGEQFVQAYYNTFEDKYACGSCPGTGQPYSRGDILKPKSSFWVSAGIPVLDSPSET